MQELVSQGVKPWDDDAWVSALVGTILYFSNSRVRMSATECTHSDLKN